LPPASSSAVNDRDVKDGRSEHAALSSHAASLSKEADSKQQRPLDRGIRDRPPDHIQRGGGHHERDDARREGNRRTSESELQRHERRHSGSHHHHHQHHQRHLQQQQQLHGLAKDDATRHHNRHAGRVLLLLSGPAFCSLVFFLQSWGPIYKISYDNAKVTIDLSRSYDKREIILC